MCNQCCLHCSCPAIESNQEKSHNIFPPRCRWSCRVESMTGVARSVISRRPIRGRIASTSMPECFAYLVFEQSHVPCERNPDNPPQDMTNSGSVTSWQSALLRLSKPCPPSNGHQDSITKRCWTLSSPL
ncbi:hypothetical protein ILYODFUR_023900 [Ilyodon furcidens]|uniref:Uncharacterized protein n=1 Tax=Ilyodon furcidens TaxID=33524 RepID=A0ABV0T1B1_9TELE